MVFYNGEDSPYPYKVDIKDLFTDKELSVAVGLGKFRLVDLTVMPEEQILKHKQLTLLEMCLKHIRARGFKAVISYIFESFIVAHGNNLGKNLFDGVLSYYSKCT